MHVIYCVHTCLLVHYAVLFVCPKENTHYFIILIVGVFDMFLMSTYLLILIQSIITAHEMSGQYGITKNKSVLLEKILYLGCASSKFSLQGCRHVTIS